MTFAANFTDTAARVEQRLADYLTGVRGPVAPPARLAEAMRYAALGGGKRLRPVLLIESAALFGVRAENTLDAAAALECVHCYSLIHDDLPAMDDDDLRRGKPTVHIAFDEATAILAGDSLLTLAFEILAAAGTHNEPSVRVALIAGLARAAGWAGMTGGQMLDLQAQELQPDKAEIERLQVMKTGALIQFSCEAGAIIGQASPDERKALKTYGAVLGRAFQISDDLLDAEGSPETVGKTTGKDDRQGKATLVALLGIDQARTTLMALEDEAKEALSCFGERAKTLIDAALFVIHRQR